MAMAVRNPDGEGSGDQAAVAPWQKYQILGWPLIRGIVILADSLIIGMRSLNRSAILAGEEDDELSTADIFWTSVLAAILAIVCCGLSYWGRTLYSGIYWRGLGTESNRRNNPYRCIYCLYYMHISP